MALPPGRSIMYKSTTQREKAEIASMTSDSGRFFPVVDPARPMVRWGLNKTLLLSNVVFFFLPFLRMILLHFCRKITLYWLSSLLLWQQLPLCWKMINQHYQLTGRGTSLGCHTRFNCLILKPHRTDTSKSRFFFSATEQCLPLHAYMILYENFPGHFRKWERIGDVNSCDEEDASGPCWRNAVEL